MPARRPEEPGYHQVLIYDDVPGGISWAYQETVRTPEEEERDRRSTQLRLDEENAAKDARSDQIAHDYFESERAKIQDVTRAWDLASAENISRDFESGRRTLPGPADFATQFGLPPR